MTRRPFIGYLNNPDLYIQFLISIIRYDFTVITKCQNSLKEWVFNHLGQVWSHLFLITKECGWINLKDLMLHISKKKIKKYAFGLSNQHPKEY